MADDQRVGGTIQLQVDAAVYAAHGNFSWNLGKVKRTAVIGPDGVHGFKEEHQVAFVEGEIVDDGSVDTEKFLNATNVTVYLKLANGKAVTLRNGWNASDGTGTTEEGVMPIRFEGKSASEVKA